MIIFLSELQKEHLKLIHQHSIHVLIDLCKLALDYLNNGINYNKYNIAADKLQVSPTDVENLVYALVYLIVEGSNHGLTDSDFKSSLEIAGFSLEQQEVLVKFQAAKKIELCEALHLLQQRDPAYQDFKWRFEIQVASQDCEEEIKPMMTMDFVTMAPKNYGHSADDKNDMIASVSVNSKSSLSVNNCIQEARTASNCQNIIKHNILQCDLKNLVHLTNKLDQALKESKSQHVRKVQRSL